ncbi:thioredoxin family protein [Peribacillus sp. NPDC096448]|uniref:thioredoxin family protein n=1 Tax=Peribacillus sp. NPDC096448 TaxID=3364395 RepID=UPI003814AB15
MKEIKTKQEFDEAVLSTKPVVAKFYVEWCPDCQNTNLFMPIVEEVYKEKIDMIAVNRDHFPELFEKLDVFGIPSFIAFQEGKELNRFVSKIGKSQEEVEQFLNQIVEESGKLKR